MSEPNPFLEPERRKDAWRELHALKVPGPIDMLGLSGDGLTRVRFNPDGSFYGFEFIDGGDREADPWIRALLCTEPLNKHFGREDLRAEMREILEMIGAGGNDRKIGLVRAQTFVAQCNHALGQERARSVIDRLREIVIKLAPLANRSSAAGKKSAARRKEKIQEQAPAIAELADTFVNRHEDPDDLFYQNKGKLLEELTPRAIELGIPSSVPTLRKRIQEQLERTNRGYIWPKNAGRGAPGRRRQQLIRK